VRARNAKRSVDLISDALPKKPCESGEVRVKALLSSENRERGEIVSPVGCTASKVSGLELAMPDARIVARSNSSIFSSFNVKASLVP